MRQISLLLALLGLAVTQIHADTIHAGDVFNWRLTGVDPGVITDIANLQFAVGPDGVVNIPLIGKMKVAGLTSSQVEDQVQARYIADKIFTKPVVIISVEQAQVQRSVTISGGVKGPGKQQWTADMTLASAIGGAGGPSDFGDVKKIRVVRDGKILGIFNLKLIDKDPSKDIKLLASDQVVIPE